MIHAFDHTEQTSDLTGVFLTELCRGLAAETGQIVEALNKDEVGIWAAFNKELTKLILTVADRGYADKTFYVTSLRTYLTAVKNPYPMRLELVGDLNDDATYRRAKRRLYPVSLLLLPWLTSIVPADAENIARLRIAQTVLAIERYRLRNGSKIPEKLTDLCPDFLPAVFQDPFDGRPLRFRILGDGYVVYSIGKDLKDSSGERQNEWQSWSSPFDIPFVVRRKS